VAVLGRLIHDRALLFVYPTFDFKGPLYILQGWFGLSGSAVNIWFRFGVRVKIALLKTEQCCIPMPNDDKIHEYKAIINAKHPVLENVFCVCDGLKIPIQSPKGYWKQGKYYNGWKHGHYITNLFVFALDGMIIFALINAPGSVHDSTLSVWGNLYQLLNQIHKQSGGKCCMDSAFAAKGNPAVIPSSEDLSLVRSARDVLIFREATSLQQSAVTGFCTT
jgi:DDE superfamily endonuclease